VYAAEWLGPLCTANEFYATPLQDKWPACTWCTILYMYLTCYPLHLLPCVTQLAVQEVHLQGYSSPLQGILLFWVLPTEALTNSPSGNERARLRKIGKSSGRAWVRL
jgi:hypothetical protein